MQKWEGAGKGAGGGAGGGGEGEREQKGGRGWESDQGGGLGGGYLNTPGPAASADDCYQLLGTSPFERDVNRGRPAVDVSES